MMLALGLLVGLSLGLGLHSLNAKAWQKTMGGSGKINSAARMQVLEGMDDQGLERLAYAVAAEMSNRPELAAGWDLAPVSVPGPAR